MDWRSDIVIMNKDGASFGDVCVYREGADNIENIVCALQAKKWKKPVPIDLLTKEHTMNTETIRNIQQGSTLDNQRINNNNARTITVLITTANVTEQAYWQFMLRADIPAGGFANKAPYSLPLFFLDQFIRSAKMRLTISTQTGELHNVEVDSQMELENFKALVEVETNVAISDQTLYHDGKELKDPKKTLAQCGIIEDDIVVLHRKTNSSTDMSVVEQMRRYLISDPGIIRQLERTNPPLAAALNSTLNNPQQFAQIYNQIRDLPRQEPSYSTGLNPDGLDIESQRKIEEAIRQQNINENYQTALEFNPEVFGRVTMLYIDVEVNRHPVKAFVDSGAQATIMSPSCAEACGLMWLVDRRFEGIARGVGTAKILGRVHSSPIRVGKDLHLACSFVVMENRGVDLLFGLDMLKRHQACIDLQKNCLIIQGQEIPFLNEHELPESARNGEFVDEDLVTPGTTSASAEGTASSSTNPAAATAVSSSDSSSSPSSDTQLEEKIKRLVQFGIDREYAIQLLEATNGDLESAANLIHFD
ncbi:10630_t:CDS:10 [Paraglomus occultum]|uniref:DNA damage-inducible protein 1 n=1 Tax=Paraglomus occultum TaxID=144539 RepID=A0A9N9FPC7_9GLOM|nr:10630_t:CDS:10 [Paraglomus occultum]